MAGSQVHSTTKVFGRGLMVEASSADKGRGAEVIRRNAEISKVGWGTFIMPFNLSAKGRNPQYIMFKAVDTYCMQSLPLPLFCGSRLTDLESCVGDLLLCGEGNILNKENSDERTENKKTKKEKLHSRPFHGVPR